MSTDFSIQSRAHFTALPEEKIIDIFTELPPNGIMSAGFVCKLFYTLSRDEILWGVKAVEEGVDITAKNEEEKKIHPARRLEEKLQKRALHYYAYSESFQRSQAPQAAQSEYLYFKTQEYANSFLLRTEEMKKTPFIGSRNILPVSERMLSAIFAYAEYTVGNQKKTKQRLSREDIASQTALVLGDRHIFEKAVQRGATPLSADEGVLKRALACAFLKNDVDLLKTIESQYFNGQLELESLSGRLLNALKKNQTEMVDFLLRYTLSPEDSQNMIDKVLRDKIPNRKQFLNKVSLDGIYFPDLLRFLNPADKNDDSAFIKRVLQKYPFSPCGKFNSDLFLDALKTGHVEIARFLCENYKGGLTKKNLKQMLEYRGKYNIFISAATSGSVEMFKFLLEFVEPYDLENIIIPTKKWYNAALKSGNENLVTFLADRYGFTPDDKSLPAAIKGKNIELVKDVLANRVEKNVSIPVPVPILSKLVSKGEIEFLTELAQLGIQPALRVPHDSIELLNSAFNSGKLEMIEFVIETWKLSVPQNIFSIASMCLPGKMLKNPEQTSKIYGYLSNLPKSSFVLKSIPGHAYDDATHIAEYVYSKTRKKNENGELPDIMAEKTEGKKKNHSFSSSASSSDDEGFSDFDD